MPRADTHSGNDHEPIVQTISRLCHLPAPDSEAHCYDRQNARDDRGGVDGGLPAGIDVETGRRCGRRRHWGGEWSHGLFNALSGRASFPTESSIEAENAAA